MTTGNKQKIPEHGNRGNVTSKLTSTRCSAGVESTYNCSTISTDRNENVSETNINIITALLINVTANKNLLFKVQQELPPQTPRPLYTPKTADLFTSQPIRDPPAPFPPPLTDKSHPLHSKLTNCRLQFLQSLFI